MSNLFKKEVNTDDSSLGENEFSFFIDNFNTAICLGKPDGSILEVNSATLEMFGYTLQELKKLNSQSIFDHTDPNLIAALEIRENKGKVKTELIGIRKNGERFPCEVSSTIYKGFNGEERTSTFLIDISQRKKLEDEISLIINLSEESFAITDRDFKLTLFNKQFKEQYKFNMNVDVKIGDSILDYTLKKQRKQDEALYTRVLNGETIETEIDIIINKEKVIIHKIVKPIIDTKGNVIGTFSSSRTITEQKRTQQLLEQLKKVTNNIDSVIFQFEISPEGKMTFPFISDSIYKLIPDIDTELLKIDASFIFSFVHPDDSEKLLLSISESRNNLTSWKFKFRQKNDEGIERWIKGSSNPCKKDDGTVVWYGYVLDITDRVASDRKIQETINQYNIINKATNDTIWDLDYVTRKINWNNGINRVYGYKNDESNINELSWWYSKIHLDDLQRVKEKVEKCFTKIDSSWDDQYRFLCANNTYKYVSQIGYLVKDEDGLPIKMIGAMNDITNQKTEEERLKLLESVITNMTDFVLITQTDKITGHQIIIYANDAFLKMNGYEMAEIYRKSPRIFQGPNTDEKELDKLKIAISNNKGCQIEIINYKKSGEEYWAKISTTPVFNTMGELSHFIAIESDVTDRKLDEIEKRQMIAELSQNYKDLKQFSYVTSHNLRSPIANLLGLTSLLDNYKMPDASLKFLLDGIRQSALIFDDTVKDLTKILIIKDQANIIKEEVSLVFVIEKILSQISLLVTENDININYELNDAPSVNFTNSYLESIFLNLFTNSIKYKSSNRKLEIEITSSQTDKFVIVKFKDNGIGIDIDTHKEKLFKLYQRFHDKSEGKGLGLYLIKSQLEAMNGEIEIESMVDVGTTFIVKFRK